MKWIERNILFIVFGFLAVCIIFQMWYISEIKSELKLFKENSKHGANK